MVASAVAMSGTRSVGRYRPVGSDVDRLAVGVGELRGGGQVDEQQVDDDADERHDQHHRFIRASAETG